MIKRARFTTRYRAVLFREPFQRSRPPEESVSFAVSEESMMMSFCVTLSAFLFSRSAAGELPLWQTGSTWPEIAMPPFSQAETAMSAAAGNLDVDVSLSMMRDCCYGNMEGGYPWQI